MEKNVSIIMSVFNGEETIKKCLDSIFQQSYNSIDIVICDDGSVDNSYSIIEAYSKRNSRFNISILRNEKNIGLPASLNRCIEVAKGPFLARMDADDQMLANRILHQVNYLEANNSIDIVGGSQLMLFGDGGSRINRPPLSNDLIKAGLFLRTTMLHPTVMLRKNFFDKNDIWYDPNYHLCEDYKLFIDLLYAGANFANIPEVVNTYDYSTKKSWDKHQDLMVNALQKLWLDNLQRIGMKYGDDHPRYFLQATGKLKVHKKEDFFKIFFFFVTCVFCNQGFFGGVFSFTYMRIKDIRLAILLNN